MFYYLQYPYLFKVSLSFRLVQLNLNPLTLNRPPLFVTSSNSSMVVFPSFPTVDCKYFGNDSLFVLRFSKSKKIYKLGGLLRCPTYTNTDKMSNSLTPVSPFYYTNSSVFTIIHLGFNFGTVVLVRIKSKNSYMGFFVCLLL